MKKLTLALLLSLVCTALLAQVAVVDPWVRATVPQQKSTGAFMQITSKTDVRLIDVRAPIAATAEIHEMSMQDNIMRMRRVARIYLPAGKTVELKPGAYHLMLFDLKRPIREGETIPLTLTFEDAHGKRQTLEVQAVVRALNGAAMPQH